MTLNFKNKGFSNFLAIFDCRRMINVETHGLIGALFKNYLFVCLVAYQRGNKAKAEN